MRPLLLGLALAFASVSVSAQQLEVNDAGGSLTRAGVNPTPGSPFTLFQPTPIDFRVGGAPNSGYILLLGQLDNPSTFIGFGINQYLDLVQASAQVIGDGIGFTGPLPGQWFVTNNTGVSNWSIPTNQAMAGQSFAFQAIVSDPTLPPLNLNFTAAAEYAISPLTLLLSFNGDDVAQQANSVNPYFIYGANRTGFQVSTNGFVKLASTGTPQNDRFEGVTTMINGTPGASAAAPLIAVDWEDLDMGNNTAIQAVRVFEDVPNKVLTIEWVNGEYFTTSPNWGTQRIIITDISGFSQIELDYTAFSPAVAPIEGLVGVSDGNTGVPAGANVQADLITAGAVNPYVSTGDFETYFQNFDGTGTGSVPAEALDTAGHTITFVDTTGNGNWTVF
jgi:hypothetical protein